MPGPNSGVHGLICVDKEGTACTKVVLQSRVLIGRWHTGGLRSYSSWDACGARLSFSRFSVFLLFGVFSGACLFGFAWPWRVVCWSAGSPRLDAARGGHRVSLVCVPVLGLRVRRSRPLGLLGRLSLRALLFWFTLDFADVLAVSVFVPFRGIFRVAGCPPGGEICRM